MVAENRLEKEPEPLLAAREIYAFAQADTVDLILATARDWLEDPSLRAIDGHEMLRRLIDFWEPQAERAKRESLTRYQAAAGNRSSPHRGPASP